MSKFYKDVCKILKAHGCYYVRSAKGDHQLWASPISNRRFIVDPGTKSRHTANAVLKQAGIDEKL
ncbi:type II toxin-antitoxin system HicA family toxin [Candidatus Spongiihabitans sp.]|uniref:type II toxin-antitoxin system HicA family toxin n=1 Tax=Candidatus Spongiihabitans sp. TaxID=3101308 RepID=UPI003C7C1376